MNKILTIFMVIAGIGTSLNAFAAESLYTAYEGKIVKVCIDEIKNSSTETDIDLAGIKAKLIDVLKSRRQITFEPVEKKEDADLLIEVNIRGFVWSDHDPVDMLFGVAATALDAAVVENYARIETYIMVLDGKKNRVLWQSIVTASVTQSPMSKSESIPLVSANLAKTFVKECFARKR